MTFNNPSGAYTWLASPTTRTVWACGGLHQGTFPSTFKLNAYNGNTVPAIASWKIYDHLNGVSWDVAGTAAGATQLTHGLANNPGFYEFEGRNGGGQVIAGGSRILLPATDRLPNVQEAGGPEAIAWTPFNVRTQIRDMEGGPARFVGDDEGASGEAWSGAFLNVATNFRNTNALRTPRPFCTIQQGVNPADLGVERPRIQGILPRIATAGIKRFMMRNEIGTEPNRGGGSNPGPNGGSDPQSVVDWARAARDSVLPIISDAEIYGPNFVSFSGARYDWTAAFADLGGFVGVRPSWHFYNQNSRASLLPWLFRMDSLLRAKTSWTMADAVCDELGNFQAAANGNGVPWEQAHHSMLSVLTLAQFGVLESNIAFFYPSERGFDGHSSWLINGTGQPYPVIGASAFFCHVVSNAGRVEPGGAVGRLGHDFGSGLNEFVVANTYREPDGTGWTVFMTDGIESQPLEFRVLGTTSAIPMHDCFGRAMTSVTPSDGRITVNATTLPQYLHLPADVRLVAVEHVINQRQFGVSVSVSDSARLPAGQSVSASSVLTAFQDARQYDVANYVNALSTYTTAGPAIDGKSWTFTWSVAPTMTNILIATPVPWEFDCVALLQGSIEYKDVSNNWHTLGTFDITPSYRLTPHGGNYRSYWVGDVVTTHTYSLSFAEITAKAVRVNGSRASYGFPPTASAYAAGTMNGVSNPGMAISRAIFWKKGAEITGGDSGSAHGYAFSLLGEHGGGV